MVADKPGEGKAVLGVVVSLEVGRMFFGELCRARGLAMY